VYDKQLERTALKVFDGILRNERRREAARSVDDVPVFCSWGVGRFDREPGPVAVASRADILAVWDKGPGNTDKDVVFLQELRRPDLPPGSFFVVVMAENRKRYHWIRYP
jgi:hypothetical protein